jgi:hypothetical protein
LPMAGAMNMTIWPGERPDRAASGGTRLIAFLT